MLEVGSPRSEDGACRRGAEDRPPPKRQASAGEVCCRLVRPCAAIGSAMYSTVEMGPDNFALAFVVSVGVGATWLGSLAADSAELFFAAAQAHPLFFVAIAFVSAAALGGAVVVAHDAMRCVRRVARRLGCGGGAARVADGDRATPAAVAAHAQPG